MLALVTATSASAQVTISGGMREADPFNYDWTITNNGKEPVTSFEISHYNGHIPVVPDGWTPEITEKAFYDEKVGVGRFKVTATGPGLREGQSATFSLHIHARGASRRYGDAIIGLANGQTLTIPNVEHPGKVSPVETLVAPISLGLLLAAFIVYQVARKRKQQSPPQQTSG
jgi:hypothetical protein